MNFMPATLEEGKLRTKLGDLPLSDASDGSVEDRRGGPRRDPRRPPGIVRGCGPGVGRQPSRTACTFRATIDVVESMGSDVFAYFSSEAAAAKAAELEELARDSGRADTGGGGDQVDREARRRHRDRARARTPSSGSTPGDARLRPGHRPEPHPRPIDLGAAAAGSRPRPRGTHRQHHRRQRDRTDADTDPRRAPAPSPGVIADYRRAGTGACGGGGRPSSFHSWVRISRYRSRAIRM